MHIPRNQRPYIGITDFANNEQVRRMLETFRANRQEGSSRRLHVGVMMSYKTLYGHPTKWSAAFPPKDTVSRIFQHTDDPDEDDFRDIIGDSMFCLHYADYDNSSNLFQSLSDAIGYAGPFTNALQLDMVWPDPSEVWNANHCSRLNLEIILQVGKNALEAVNDDPREMVERLRDYEKVITHVLLDKSMGKGLGMDAPALLPFARAIRDNFPQIGIVVAGGLGPETMHLVEPLVGEFPDISIDAQGRLRPSSNALDPIDWDMAQGYLIQALRMLK